MKKITPPKRLPIPLAIVLLLAGIGAGVFLVNRSHSFRLKASEGIAPQQARITNIGSSSFVVSWTTTQPTTGEITLVLSEGNEKRVGDLRDVDQTQSGNYQTHYVRIDDQTLGGDRLSPETKYNLRIISGGKGFSRLEITTGPQKIPPDSDVAQGRILLPNGQPASGAIVYLSLANTSVQSSLADSAGHWMIPLSLARTADLKNFSNYDRRAQIEEIFVTNGLEQATATLTTGNDNPTPDITLGQEYNFLNQLEQPSPTPTTIIDRGGNTDESGGNQGGFSSGSGFQQSLGEEVLTITFPSENEKVNSAQPEFFGTGPNGEELQIKVESEEEIADTAQVTETGSWKWSPPTPLTPGEHTITVAYTDSTGFIKKVSRKFTVLAMGESDLPSFTATPSGQTTTPTAISTTLPTATPTQNASVSTAPTSTARQSVADDPSDAPQSGLDGPTKIFFGLGAAAIIVGAVFSLF